MLRRLLRRLFGSEEAALPAAPFEPGYMSPAGYHRHRCSRCKCIWEHPNSCAGADLAHLCPECGHDDGDLIHGWPRYYGPLPPDVITRTIHD